MARIKKLDSTELDFLRERILATFAARHPEEILPPRNAYLPNYEELKSDMIEAIPFVNGSISENRLRKLFYYTDTKAIDKHALQRPRFGIDFLNACYKYISDDTIDRATYKRDQVSETVVRPQKNMHWLLLPSLAVIALGLIYWQITSSDSPLAFEPTKEQFEDVSLKGLNQRGWQILDFDQTHFQDQLKEGHFTMYTLPGSFWVKPNEDIAISNMLVHPIPAHSSGVRACFDRFMPYQDWQSIGMILFDENLNRLDVVVIGFGYASTQVSPFVFTGFRIKSGTPDMPFFTKPAYPENSTGDALRLDIRWADDKYLFYTGANSEGGFSKEWDPFQKFGEIDMTFDPRYVGIFACQGWTNDNYEPIGADVIPVFLDWIEFY